MSKKVIGILGGMGPLATADLFQKITLHTVAACDQAHPRVCIDSNTDIADRTAALLHGGEDPVPEMIKSAKRLESIGADFLIMPCNTAHNYYEQVCSRPTARCRPASTSAPLSKAAWSFSRRTAPTIRPR